MKVSKVSCILQKLYSTLPDPTSKANCNLITTSIFVARLTLDVVISRDDVLHHGPGIIHPADDLEQSDLIPVLHAELHHEAHGGGALGGRLTYLPK